jgi:hypothetical protein
MMDKIFGWGLVLFNILLLEISQPVQAQGLPTLTLAGGQMRYDRQGSGTVGFSAVRIGIPVSKQITIEPDVTVGGLGGRNGTAYPMLIPEVQVQASWKAGQIQPFVGVGVGAFFDLRGNRQGLNQASTMFSGVVGARSRISFKWSAQAEIRARAIDQFNGNTLELTAGVARRF